MEHSTLIHFIFGDLLQAELKSRHFVPHFHEEYSIGWIHDGYCNMECDGTLTKIVPGQLILLNPYQVHSARTSSFLSYEMRYVKQAFVRDFLGELKAFSHKVVTAPEVIQALEKGKDDTAIYQAVFSQYAHAPLQISLEKNRLLQKACHFIEGQWEPPLSLHDLSNFLGLSPTYCSRWFKKNIGIPPRTYHRLFRLAKAKDMIRKGISLSDAAFACGFSDQSHMTKELSTFFGVTPANLFRKQDRTQQ
ncbi:AraC family transcriptional regulator [Terasakiella pusilla]|uniref:AraC family transcriptional regulator n=1 Tax=Terasakiella pusilla TaxID=64973 RepID=UPI00048C919F|nr:AraC family transcriptional regulator [Terasakiella pusilla]